MVLLGVNWPLFIFCSSYSCSVKCQAFVESFKLQNVHEINTQKCVRFFSVGLGMFMNGFKNFDIFFLDFDVDQQSDGGWEWQRQASQISSQCQGETAGDGKREKRLGRRICCPQDKLPSPCQRTWKRG